jgi:hypothetical protein
MTMLKKISAALLAVSVLAAPALAATGKTTEAPATKSMTVKTGVNANAGKHHYRHYSHRRHHKSVAAINAKSKVGYKHAAPTTTKRG